MSDLQTDLDLYMYSEPENGDLIRRAIDRINELEAKLRFLVDNHSINDISIEKEINELLST